MAVIKRKKIEINSPRVKAIFLAFLLVLVAAVALFIWKFNREMRKEAVSPTPAPVSNERKNELKPLTAGQLQEALTKKAEGQIASKPLTKEEIQKALNAKVSQ